MSRILAYTSPARGHLYPLTPILDELQTRGHEIALRTLAPGLEAAQARGFSVKPIDPAIEELEHEDWREKSPQKALARSLVTMGKRAEVEAPDLKKAIAEEAPDALLVDIICYGAMAAADASGLPWAAFCPFPLPVASKDAPPFGPGYAPARNPAGRVRDRVAGPLIRGTLSRALLPLVNGVREREGLSTFSRLDEIFEAPPLLLYMTAEPFEYHRRDWSENVTMIGPCAWEPPSDTPAWLDEIDAPIVLVSTSSEFQDDAKIVEAAFEACAEQDVFVIATVPARDADQFAAPANARVESFVAHGPILDRAVCAVTHGGMGVTQKALSRGVPVVVIPHGRDQLEVARRAVEANAGVRIPERKLDPQRLRAAVAAARKLRSGAERVADGYKKTGGAVAAADAFEAKTGIRTPVQSGA